MIGDKYIDRVGVEDAMLDLANEYGDVFLIKVIEEWLENKMGGRWLIINKEELK